jgi:multidrug efflux system membrane fusion protein
VVPTVAVQHGPQGTYVYAVGVDRTAQMKPVTIALAAGELSVVGKGLDAGEQVIIEGQNQVRPGGRVQPSGTGSGSGAGSGHGPAAGGGHGSAAGGGPSAARPDGGQSRPRGPAAGPTASNQAPAAP